MKQRIRTRPAIAALVVALTAIIIVVFGFFAATYFEHKTNEAYSVPLYVNVTLEKRELDGAGQVVAGRYVAGAEFYLFHEGEDGRTTQIGARYVTDVDGRILVEGLEPGRYFFLETDAGYGYVIDQPYYPFTIAKREPGATDVATHITVPAGNYRIGGGSLTIVKELRNDDGSTLTDEQLEKEFTFNVVFSEAGAYPYEIWAGEESVKADEIDTDGTLTLRAGERAVFPHLLVGLMYTVTEVQEEGYITRSTDSQGHIVLNEEESWTRRGNDAVAVFTNTHVSAGVTTIAVGDGSDPEAGSLRLINLVRNEDGSPLAGQQLELEFEYIVTVGTEETGFEEYAVKLRHGEALQIIGIPPDTPYTIEVKGQEGYKCSVEEGEITGVIEGGKETTVTVVHTRGASDEPVLRVTKTVEGDLASGNEDYEFEYVLEVDGEEVRTFSLHNGQTATFSGLPAGLPYTVYEANAFTDGYALTHTVNATGTFIGDVDVEFVNTFIGYTMIAIEGEKTWVGGGELPDSITLNLYSGELIVATAETDAAAGWHYKFIAPKYDTDGLEIAYTIDEVAIAGWVSEAGAWTYDPARLAGAIDDPVGAVANRPLVEDSQTALAPTTYIYIYGYGAVKEEIEEETEEGVGADVIRPSDEEETDDEEEIEEEEETEEEETEEDEADEENEDDVVGEGLDPPAEEDSEDPIGEDETEGEDDEVGATATTSPLLSLFPTLTVYAAEPESEGWREAVTVDITGAAVPPPADTKTLNLTNTWYGEAAVSVTVTKIWRDGGPDDPDRPERITVQLLRDTEAYRTVTLSHLNGWSYTWPSLEPGREWTVDETETPFGYSKEITGSVATGFTITNRNSRAGEDPDPSASPGPGKYHPLGKVSKTGGSGSYKQGDTITYTITVTLPASLEGYDGIEIVDSFNAAELEYIAGSSSLNVGGVTLALGDYDIAVSTGEVRATVGKAFLAPKARVALRLGFTVIGSGTITNSASAEVVPEGGYEPYDPSPRGDSVTIEAEEGPDPYAPHTVTYRRNGGTGGPYRDSGIPHGTVYIIREADDEAVDIKRDGYVFVGWNTERNGSGTAYPPGTEITVNADLTLYAQWAPLLYFTPSIVKAVELAIEEGAEPPEGYVFTFQIEELEDIDASEGTLLAQKDEGYEDTVVWAWAPGAAQQIIRFATVELQAGTYYFRIYEDVGAGLVPAEDGWIMDDTVYILKLEVSWQGGELEVIRTLTVEGDEEAKPLGLVFTNRYRSDVEVEITKTWEPEPASGLAEWNNGIEFWLMAYDEEAAEGEREGVVYYVNHAGDGVFRLPAGESIPEGTYMLYEVVHRGDYGPPIAGGDWVFAEELSGETIWHYRYVNPITVADGGYVNLMPGLWQFEIENVLLQGPGLPEVGGRGTETTRVLGLAIMIAGVLALSIYGKNDNVPRRGAIHRARPYGWHKPPPARKGVSYVQRE